MTDDLVSPTPAPTETPTPQIPEDLQGQLNTIQALAHCHTLLQQGAFARPYWNAVDQGMKFLADLGNHCKVEANKHPSAHLIPEEMKVPSGQS